VYYSFILEGDRLDEPIGSIFIGPSAVPSEMNAGYKVFMADGVREEATWELISHQTHVINLTLTDAAGFPVFNTSVDSKEIYELKDLRTESLVDFIERMARSPELFTAYK